METACFSNGILPTKIWSSRVWCTYSDCLELVKIREAGTLLHLFYQKHWNLHGDNQVSGRLEYSVKCKRRWRGTIPRWIDYEPLDQEEKGINWIRNRLILEMMICLHNTSISDLALKRFALKCIKPWISLKLCVSHVEAADVKVANKLFGRHWKMCTESDASIDLGRLPRPNNVPLRPRHWME